MHELTVPADVTQLTHSLFQEAYEYGAGLPQSEELLNGSVGRSLLPMHARNTRPGRPNEPARLQAARLRTAAEGEEEMKLARAAHQNLENGSLSIPAAEEIIEEALNELAFSQDPGLVRALRFLAPPGYQAIVDLRREWPKQAPQRYGGYLVT